MALAGGVSMWTTMGGHTGELPELMVIMQSFSNRHCLGAGHRILSWAIAEVCRIMCALEWHALHADDQIV